MLSRSISIKTTMELIHHWPDAPPEVYFLRQMHRHELYIECTIAVEHDDRDLEFIMVKRFVDEHLRIARPGYPRSVSCEMIASDVISALRRAYGDRKITVKVFEDNENGAIVEYMPD